MVPCKGVKLFEDGQRLFLTTEERHQFRDTMHSLDTLQRVFCRLMYYTGCKLHEAVEFYPNQVKARDGYVLLGTKGKNLLERFVPIPPAFNMELSIYLRPQTRSGSRPLWTMSRTTGWRLINDAMNKSGIRGKQATPTGLRHSFAISCFEVSPRIPLDHIRKWMGHRKPDLTASYLKAFQQDEIESLRRLWNHF